MSIKKWILNGQNRLVTWLVGQFPDTEAGEMLSSLDARAAPPASSHNQAGSHSSRPPYDCSWLAAGGTAAPDGVLSMNNNLAYTHTPGTGFQERPEDKQASAAQPALSRPW